MKEKEQFQNAFLHLVDYGYPSVVKKMIKYVDIKTRSAGFFLAVDKGDSKIVKILLKSGVDINVKEDFYGNTALIKAIDNGDKKIVKLLLESGADVNIKNNCKQDALFRASVGGKASIVKLLLKNGADVNIRNIEGFNAYDLAVAKKRRRIEQLLKEAGVETKKNKD